MATAVLGLKRSEKSPLGEKWRAQHFSRNWEFSKMLSRRPLRLGLPRFSRPNSTYLRAGYRLNGTINSHTR
jgi:hypothetical protein